MANNINGRKMRKMDHISYEIVESIFQYLRVKSLLRFKCISKKCCELIMNPDFTDQHLLKQQQNDPQFFVASPPPPHPSMNHMVMVMGCMSFVEVGDQLQVYIDWKPINNLHLPKDYYYFMSCSCDGILCFYGSLYIHLYDPCTGEFRTLPQPTTHTLCMHFPAYMNPHYYAGYCPPMREYSRTQNYQLVGCGRDPVTKDYKIIRIFSPTCSNSPDFVYDQCEIFTLNPDPRAKWKSIGSVPYKVSILQRPVYVNGAIYMFTDENFRLYEVIVMFDLSLKILRLITPPECCSYFQRRCPMNLVSLRGCLCLGEQYRDDPLNIWIMKDVISTSSDTRTVIWEKFYNFSTPIDDSLIDYGMSFKFSIAERKDGTVLIYGCEDLLYLYKNYNNYVSGRVYGSVGQFMLTT